LEPADKQSKLNKAPPVPATLLTVTIRLRAESPDTAGLHKADVTDTHAAVTHAVVPIAPEGV
jgi:hypothetical protein